MMKMYFDCDLDYLEVFFEMTENYAHQISDEISEFLAESDDRVVGYAFDNSSLVFEFDEFTSSQKLAVLLFVSRKHFALTQIQMADKLELDIRQYQRLESGENNTTLKSIDQVRTHLPDIDFSVILKGA